MPISESIRWKIVHAFDRPKSITAMANDLGLTRRAVRHWVCRYRDVGNVRNAPGRGRKGILNVEVAEQAAELLRSPDVPTATTVSRKLYRDGLTPRNHSKSAITRAVRKTAGGSQLSSCRGKPRKKLSSANCEKRLAFAQKHKKQSWLHTIFTDRNKLKFSYQDERVGRGRRVLKWVEGGVEGQQVNALGCKTFTNSGSSCSKPFAVSPKLCFRTWWTACMVGWPRSGRRTAN